MVGFFFDDNLGMGAFFKVVILEGVGKRDSTIGDGAMIWCFVEGEDGAVEDGPVLLADGRYFSFS